MKQNPPEVVTAIIAFMAFWLVTVLIILIGGQYLSSIRTFRHKMLAKWKPAAVLAALFILGMGLGGRSLINPYAIAIFCQGMIGLAIASDIESFEPLPVTNAIVQRKEVFRQIGVAILLAIVMVMPALIIGTIGLDIGQQIFGETDFTRQAANTLPDNKWLTFFLLLGGAGIAEETTYRLVCLSLLWKLTKRKWLAIILSAVLFGAYHLLPLNGMYRIFLQFPISQFLASALIGLVWGWLYTKRGYETVVLGHTLSDWLPLMLFT